MTPTNLCPGLPLCQTNSWWATGIFDRSTTNSGRWPLSIRWKDFLSQGLISFFAVCSRQRMLLFFQVGTSLSSRECLTSVKTMTSLRWKPDSFYNFFYQKADTLAQVVLGHEMAHSVIGHTAEQLTRASFIQVSTNLRVGAGRRYQPLAYV